MRSSPNSSTEPLRPILAGAALFLLILVQLCFRLQFGPGGLLQNADSAKFVSLCLDGGAAHSPCYPLYILLARLFFRLKLVFDPGARLSLFSAFLMSGAFLFLWDFLRRRFGSLLYSFLAVLTVSFLPYAVIAGTEATPVALSLFLFFLALDLLSRPGLPLFIRLLPCGLLMFHDPLALWYGAMLFPVALAVFIREKRAGEFLLASLCALFCGLMPYLYLCRMVRQGIVLEYPDPFTFAGLGKAVLNGQFWSNYFCLAWSGAGDNFLAFFADFFSFSALPLFLIPVLLLGLFFAKPGRGAFLLPLCALISLVATLLFCVQSYHFYPAQWYWLLSAFIMLFTAMALLALALSEKLRPVLLPLVFLALVIFSLRSFSPEFKRRSSLEAVRLAHTYGALPYDSILLSEDLYGELQFYRYHLLAYPELVKEKIGISESTYPGKRNFFFSPRVKNFLDENGVPYHLFTEVDGIPLYELGEKYEREEE